MDTEHIEKGHMTRSYCKRQKMNPNSSISSIWYCKLIQCWRFSIRSGSIRFVMIRFFVVVVVIFFDPFARIFSHAELAQLKQSNTIFSTDSRYWSWFFLKLFLPHPLFLFIWIRCTAITHTFVDFMQSLSKFQTSARLDLSC